MKRLNLLFITKDRSQQLERSSYYLERELEKITNLTKWYKDGHISTILNQQVVKPDFILINDYKPEYSPYIRGLKELTIPHGILMHDLHYKLSKRNFLIGQEKPALIFCHYRDAFKKWLPDHIDRLVWFPHHVPLDIFHRNDVTKDIPLLLIGATFPHIYPFRHKLLQQYNRDPRFVLHSHPGYGEVKLGLSGESYAREISRAKIFLTCDSIHHFPLLKYFEVLACGTLLAGSGSQELSELGFIDGKTFVQIDEVNFQEKIDYYLENEVLRNQIVNNGQSLIQERHTTEIRAKQMVDSILNYLHQM
ncbi:glycosyltransferase [Fictibacillus nanhaiensis]|uniref:glycosyltransferase n=1 Tax=Fictibacillus nanhaiensis TaxID=742169 RepID=UPI002E1EAD98|nr:glycosyltransferase [Fictibacillus nanhaiensis]